ncbi:MAG TPA: type I methionyl aminopeptidase [Terriglobales bacterium]|nr:type I methionyl aminopeptidase [Terriglobales bacterium]
MSIKSLRDLEGLSGIGKIVARVLVQISQLVSAGISTAALDDACERMLREEGAKATPREVYGYPRHLMVSINDEAVHGLPGTRIIQPGDLVSLDLTADKNGYVADAAVTIAVEGANNTRRKLAACAKAAFECGLAEARPGVSIRRIGRAVEAEVQRQGFSVIRELTGHGVGRTIHEAPTVPNFDDPSANTILTEGLVLTIEPIICAGTGRVYTAADHWTLKTQDRSPAAHFEHTIVVRQEGPLILTAA